MAEEDTMEIPDTIEGQLPGKPCPSGLRRIKAGEPIPVGWAIVKKNSFFTYIDTCIEPISPFILQVKNRENAETRGGQHQ